MIKTLLKNIQGDRATWAIVALLALFSFLPIYSASSNLEYVVGRGTSLGYLLKHMTLLVLGFAIIFGVHKIPYNYFKGLSIISLPIVVILLIFTLAQGTTIENSNASRWIQVPIFGLSFQTSALASVVIITYTARYLSKFRENPKSFKKSFMSLWFPVFGVLALILPANFSTAFIIFCIIIILCFLAYYPIKYILNVLGISLLGLILFVFIAKAFPKSFSNRVDTWSNRIENFFDGKKDPDADYQIEKSKIAISNGRIMGVGAGKSVMKNFLPQSYSDFIYAIIIEEYGLAGGLGLLLLYMLLLFRIVVVVNKAKNAFAKLLVAGTGFSIVFQAFINMGVTVELFPVTGQTLPLISSGGTSIWVTCLSLGILLSVSNKLNQKESEEIDKDEENQENINPLDILNAQV